MPSLLSMPWATSWALSVALTWTAPPEPTADEPADAPSEVAPDAPPDAPPPDAPPTEAPTSEPPHPTLGPGVMPGTVPPDEDGPTRPPTIEDPPAADPSTSPRREPDPDALEYALASREDLPYFATGARKSSVRRNNDILVRSFRRPVYSLAAAARLGVLLNGGDQLVFPVGWGVALQLRAHFLRVVKSRFGLEFHGGHTRFQRRDDFESFSGATVTRTTLLTHTDFSIGPSMHVPLGAVFLQFGGTVGAAVSSLGRPTSADGNEDDQIAETNLLLRGGASLGVPILNRHGLNLAAGVHHVFSQREIAVDPLQPEGDKDLPFRTWLEVSLGYQVWF